MITAAFVLLMFVKPDPGEQLVPYDPFQAAIIAALHRFATDGELAHVRAIIEKYPNLVDAKRIFPRFPSGKPHSTGRTPLQLAAWYGNEKVVVYLLDKGADVNTADDHGYTPLHFAAEKGHLDVVKRLVKAGAKLDAKTMAFPEYYPDNADPGPESFGGKPVEKCPAIPARTALQIAQDQKRPAVVEYLKTLK
ncbi:MAG: ankyrin repeat domain-containing protein [Planctomycetes bacterium]|nr:ankyrin repeat domain-containing protein [Planctomycetota bacterium]